MPGMDVERTFHELTSRQPSPEVVLCTGFLPGETRSPFVSRGRLRVVQKPFTAQSFMSAARETRRPWLSHPHFGGDDRSGERWL
jgi:DNA-binding NtrC family response regulator